MQHRYIVCDPELCTGCRICEFVCSAAKVGAFYPELSRIRTAHPEPTLVMSVACRLCQDPPCVAVCPRQALSVNGDNGTVLLDKVRCVGCGWCIEACDFGAIALDPSTKTVVICDLCSELPQPKCVELCPKGALSLATAEEVAQRARNRAVRAQLTSERI
jgi:Fe-S-cluster-containing hydrogenase component 2